MLKAIGKGFWRAVVVLFLLLFLWSMASGADPTPGPSQRQVEIDTMLDFYGCWAPGTRPGAEPSHAVVSYKGGHPNLVSAVLGRDIWRHPEENPGLTVHGFCGEVR